MKLPDKFTVEGEAATTDLVQWAVKWGVEAQAVEELTPIVVRMVAIGVQAVKESKTGGHCQGGNNRR